MHHLAEVRYHLWHFQDGTIKKEVEEIHKMRYFFPLELEALLEVSGLELLHLFDFNQPHDLPGLQTWNVIGVARAVE
jgi:hypothetical protein